MNRLINETSPYLLQHANNPVDWFPWCSEALEKARKENKLLLISIGYSSCHWCHVMEHESFEDVEVATIMNNHFVCIKVDREERPDIDRIYMDAVQLMNGQGGWPLNCFALPDQRPIYGGTYFRKKDWINILLSLSTFYKEKPEEAHEYAARLTEGIRNQEHILSRKERYDFSEEDLKTIFESWKKSFDYQLGGYNYAPKFPLPNNFLCLLRYAHFMQDKDVDSVVQLTLEKMAYGGIYDQLGGGFARYAVDTAWKIPHFEKMLYDNAQLIGLYAEAWRKYHNPLYKKIVYDTINFLKREMMSSESGFYSAIDADSESVEGKFYVWAQEEIAQILGDDEQLFGIYYNILKEGNWEHGTNILIRKKTDSELASLLGCSVEELMKVVERSTKKLMEARNKRIRPSLDDKIITSWNGLIISGLCESYKSFGEKEFLNLALKNATFIHEKLMQKDGSIFRIYKEGKASVTGFLDDYSSVAIGFIHLYQLTFNEQWLVNAKKLVDFSIQHFYDKASGMFWYTSDFSEQLIARKQEILDQVIPSSNSMMAHALNMLSTFYDDDHYANIANQMLTNVYNTIPKHPSAYSNWISLMMNQIFPRFEVAICGKDALSKAFEFNELYLPNVLLMGTTSTSNLPLLQYKSTSDETKIFVCSNRTCQAPVTYVNDAVNKMKELSD